ncbi:hypothetical protein PCE1_000039 [Barthelona sp. PCE]
MISTNPTNAQNENLELMLEQPKTIRAFVHGTTDEEFESDMDSVLNFDLSDSVYGYANATFANTEKTILGCAHYQRGCLTRCPDCDKFYTCRVCHDSSEDHKIDRRRVKEIICMRCSTIQEPHGTCKECGLVMGEYYCDKCRLWSNRDFDDYPIYHCDDCGVCRIGRGLGIDAKHDHKNGLCIMLSDVVQSASVIELFKTRCCICYESLFEKNTENGPLHGLPCGHVLHHACFLKLIEHQQQNCPLCRKSIIPPELAAQTWSNVDKMLIDVRVEEPYRHILTIIKCNDCDKQTIAPFDFQYHCCDWCKSYNTCSMRKIWDPEKIYLEVSEEEIQGNPSVETMSLRRFNRLREHILIENDQKSEVIEFSPFYH